MAKKTTTKKTGKKKTKKTTKSTKKLGRPTVFNDALCEKMIQLYEKGKTDQQVADIIGVSRKTINNWKGKHPDFVYALREMKQVADSFVEASLFSRAVGFSHEEQKVFQYEGQIVTHETVKQYPPDVTAAIFWLKNRQPDRWRDKTEQDIQIDLGDQLAKARERAKKGK